MLSPCLQNAMPPFTIVHHRGTRVMTPESRALRLSEEPAEVSTHGLVSIMHREIGVQGSAVGQDGRSSSLTAPNGPSQQVPLLSVHLVFLLVALPAAMPDSQPVQGILVATSLCASQMVKYSRHSHVTACIWCCARGPSVGCSPALGSALLP